MRFLSPVDDYYALLGVHVTADGAELRRAWRRLAVRWHPDRAGSDATATFQKLSAAYNVLANPLARAAYDRRRREAGYAHGEAVSMPTSARPARPPVPGVLLGRISGPLNSLLACGAVRIDDDEPSSVITLVLHPHEAAQGGMATISMRVDVHCSKCAAREGAARHRSTRCVRCGGTGAVEELFSAWLSIPPGVMAGELLAPSVDLSGMIEPVRFRVRLVEAR